MKMTIYFAPVDLDDVEIEVAQCLRFFSEHFRDIMSQPELEPGEITYQVPDAWVMNAYRLQQMIALSDYVRDVRVEHRGSCEYSSQLAPIFPDNNPLNQIYHS